MRGSKLGVILGLFTLGGAAIWVLAGVLGEFGDELRRSRKDTSALREELERTRAELAAADRRLQRMERDSNELAAATALMVVHQGRVRELLSRRLDEFEERLKHQAALSEALKDDLAKIRTLIGSSSIEVLQREVLYPSVRVEGKDVVGGGTLIYSKKEGGAGHTTYVLTASHVVRKPLRTGPDGSAQVNVKLYTPEGRADRVVSATVMARDDVKDIALLRLNTDAPFQNVVALASRNRIREVKIFTPVYAVGCPLGHDPFPTVGAISSLSKQVGGQNFWMMNAPTIFGNSGGGVFLRETHEMIGISNMICTFDNFVATPVYHMSVLLPLDVVYDWLDAQYLTYVYDPRVSREDCERMRAAARGTR